MGNFSELCSIWDGIAKRFFGTPERINGRNHRRFASWQVVRSPGSSNLLLLQIDQICVDKGSWILASEPFAGTSPSIHEPTASSKSGISSGEQPYSKLLDQDGGVFGENQTLCRRLRQAARQESFWQSPSRTCSGPQESNVAVLSKKMIGPKGWQAVFFHRNDMLCNFSGEIIATKPPDGQPLGRESRPPTNLNLGLGLGSIPIVFQLVCE